MAMIDPALLPDWYLRLVAENEKRNMSTYAYPASGPEPSLSGEISAGSPPSASASGSARVGPSAGWMSEKLGTPHVLDEDWEPHTPSNPILDLVEKARKANYEKGAKSAYEQYGASRAEETNADNIPVNPALLDPNVTAPSYLNTPVDDTTVATPTNPFSADVNTVEQLYKLYGIDQRPTDNPAQDKADAYAQRELERTKLLAQLALASGVASAGGGAWADIGRGFGAAANVYDTGFQRYSDALQRSADRYAERVNQDFADRQAKTAMVADLYQSRQSNEIAREKLKIDSDKASEKEINDFFKQIFSSENFLDPDYKQAMLDAYKRSLELGRVWLPVDVREK